MKKTLVITRTAVIAALYAVTTLLLYPISFGPVQCRVSEALTILPLFYAEAVPGLAIGCFIANCFSGMWTDMVLGTAATVVAASVTYFCRKIYLGVTPPVLLNAFIVPVIFLLAGDASEPYWFNVLTVGAGEAVAVLIGGVALYFALLPAVKRYRFMAATRFSDLMRAKKQTGLPDGASEK